MSKHALPGTYLITGITGFIGSLLTKHLLMTEEYKEGSISVLGVVRNQKKADEMYQDYDMSYVTYITGDIRALSYTMIREQIGDLKLDYIIHCAGITKSAKMVAEPVETADGIVFGTRNLLELARKYAVKSMVYLSSMEMYGCVPVTAKRISEKEQGGIDPLNTRNCYQLGKAMAENYCYDYYEEYGVPVKIARLAQVFGKGMIQGENRIFAQFAQSVVSNQDIVLHTAGESMGNYCSTSDAVAAIFLLLKKGKNGEAYNVVNEQNTMRIHEMATLVAKEIAGDRINVVFDIPEGNAYGYATDTGLRLSSKKLESLGWKPKKNLITMYEELIEEAASRQIS